MLKNTLLPLGLSLCAATALAGEPPVNSELQLAAEARALCEAQSIEPTSECMRIALGDEDADAVEAARQAH